MSHFVVFVVAAFLFSCEQDRRDESEIPISNATIAEHELGQLSGVSKTTYIPIYSNLLYHDDKHQIALHSTVSVRNLSTSHGFKVVSATYFDSNGKKVRELVDSSFGIRPMATYEFVIPEGDLKGGSGAKILIEWESPVITFPTPLIEAIFLGKRGTSEFSFSSRGVLITDVKR